MINHENATLFHYWRSSSSWRVRWALELKQLKCKMIEVNLLNGESESAEHRARNPFGYVPVLKVGDEFLTESVAIIEWLDETVPAPALYPDSALSKAKVRALVEAINAGTQPVQNPNVAAKYSDDEGKRKEWNQFFIRQGLRAYEELIQKTAGKFSFGDHITAADLFLIPQCYNALRFEVALSEFPKIEKIYHTALATKECEASSPEKYQPK